MAKIPVEELNRVNEKIKNILNTKTDIVTLDNFKVAFNDFPDKILSCAESKKLSPFEVIEILLRINNIRVFIDKYYIGAIRGLYLDTAVVALYKYMYDKINFHHLIFNRFTEIMLPNDGAVDEKFLDLINVAAMKVGNNPVDAFRYAFYGSETSSKFFEQDLRITPKLFEDYYNKNKVRYAKQKIRGD